MDPALDGSLPVWHFKCGDAIEIRNEIIFDFYMGLSRVCVPHQKHIMTSSADFGLSLAQRTGVHNVPWLRELDGTHEALFC